MNAITVPKASKSDARRTVAGLSRELDWGKHELCVRINPRGTRDFAADLAAMQRCERVDCLIVPKAEGDCSLVHTKTQKKLIPVIETATGLVRLREVASSKGAVAVSYGAADYAVSVGGSVSAYQDNSALKTTIVAAAADAGLDAIDNVFFDLEDARGFRRQALAARSLGFVGKQVVHPSQIGLANEIFSPSKQEIEWANAVVEAVSAAARSQHGATRMGGSLVDAVHYRMAKALIERAREVGLS
jgi:citrate lyase subunit beta/citryl-CoA lyase